MTRTSLLRRGLAASIGALCAASLLAAPALAELRIEDAWARATAGAARNGAAYFTIVNLGAAPDRLVAAETAVAAAAELHTHLVEDGVMRMREVKAIEIDPGTPTVLRPGGLHVMLLGLKAPLKVGESFPLTLRLEKAGDVTVDVAVRRNPPPASGHAQGGHLGN